MIVFHAIWDSVVSGKLHLWAESSTMPVMAAKRGKRGKQVEEQTQTHPFTLPYKTLREALGEIAGSLLAQSAELDALTLRLPSTAKGPQSSPELIREQEDVGQDITGFKAWDVETLTLAPGTALDFLLSLPDNAHRGIVFGGSLRFWSMAVRFASELIVGQAYMPALQEKKHDGRVTYRAAWQAVLSDDDTGRMAQLAQLMPPVCWSYRPLGDKPASLPREMLLHFLNATVDAFVRESLSVKDLLPVQSRQSAKTLTLPEQWLTSLASGDGTLTGTAKELRVFAQTLQTWLGQLSIKEADSSFRTCFRLDPPFGEDTESKDWHISFHLQAKDDRSLLVPAEQVWRERSDTLTFLKRKFENPQERLLADLGKASRLFPAIEDSLKTAHPSELTLDTEQAYQFLRQSAPLLEQSGFGVLVPPWWNKASAKPRVKLKIKGTGDVASRGLLSLDGIVAYDWKVAIGDTTLSANEFEDLVSLKMPLIQVRGQWVELRPEEIEAAIAFFKKKQGNGTMTFGEALRLGLGQDSAEVGLPVDGIEGDGWMQDILDKLSGNSKLTPVKVPPTFQGKLRPYQVKGVSWLAFLQQFGFGACLADDMGLGKCCAPDTLLFVNGMLQTAEEIWQRNAGETTFDGEGYWTDSTEQLLTNSLDEHTGQIVQAPVKHMYRQQVHTHLRKIRLEDGNCITITYPHKLLTHKGWTNDLHVGDYVCVPAQLIWHGKSEDPDLIKMLAWQIAEGYEISNVSTVRITQKDTAILEELRQCFQRIGKKFGIKINCPTINTGQITRVPNLRITSIEYRRFLERKGYEWGNLSSSKRIPDFIMQADLDSIKIFLRNYFEAEASVIESMHSIEISTASPVMIQQLSYLLRRFGIWMRISTKQKRATNGAGIFRPYQIGVLGGNAARKFYEEVGFLSERKQQKLEKICERISNTNVEGIPASEIMTQTVAATKLPIRHFGMKTVYITGSQQFSTASLQKVVSAFDDILSGEAERVYREKPTSKWTVQALNAYAQLDTRLLAVTRTELQRLINQEVYYCRIKSIEDIEYDGWVYDFEVEQHHNFVANNILCHNTIQLITLLLHERHTQKTLHGPSLIICPMSIVGNWHRELQRFAPSLSVMIHHGAERLTGPAFEEEVCKHDVVITTYALALRDKEHLSHIDWQYLVIDEAQNIKNEAAKQTQAIKSIPAVHKIALTGTPVENRLSELWSIMEFLNPGYLGSGTDFRKHFAIPIERYHNASKAESLKHLIQPFVLRRVKTDKTIIKDLPDKMEMKVYCNLTQEQASLYEAVVKEMMEKIEDSDGMERRGLILATLMKLKQVCNHPTQFIGDGSSLSGRSGKLARLEEMLEEALAEGDKALIFTQFAEMGKLLRTYLKETLGQDVLFLHGGTPKKERDAIVQRFQEDRHGPPIFILSLKAGGVGLNLTGANHVFHFDRWWNPAVENQATDRAFRIGQLKNVQVHKFISVGTLEERIDQMIEDKKALAENIVGSGENWLTEMSTSQLKELFALSREAVGI
ncbi:MAG TPA: SNF2-related protein [Ktedonobacteraceae bacterium]|nr:SNF2-related protein [Ktedonobacteraceae bacterium]